MRTPRTQIASRGILFGDGDEQETSAVGAYTFYWEYHHHGERAVSAQQRHYCGQTCAARGVAPDIRGVRQTYCSALQGKKQRYNIYINN